MRLRLPKSSDFIFEKPKNALIISLSLILWAFCYPPFHLGLISPIVLVPAMLATLNLKGTTAFRYFFLGGIFHNIVMYWWIYNVMKVGPAFVIAFGLVILILFLSLFQAIMGWLFQVCLHKKRGLLIYPLLWTGHEVVRTKGEISFPWEHLGYTLGHYLPLIQISAWIGIFGLSFLIISTNVLVFAGIQKKGFPGLAYPGIAVIIWGLVWVTGIIRLQSSPEDKKGKVTVSMVQPSIPQTKKWDEEYFQGILKDTWDVMEEKLDTLSKIDNHWIILAETAIPEYIRYRPAVIKDFFLRAKSYNANIIVGALDLKPSELESRDHTFFNAAFLFSPDSLKSLWQYNKIRLVPFSEKLPFDQFFPVLNYVDLGEGDFTPGEGYVVWGDAFKISPSICYEIIYPSFVRGAVKAGADLLVNITNDGWFGNSGAPYQHANISRFRSIEVGLPMARCSNSGISVFYDAKGRILGKTRLFEKTVLQRELNLDREFTVYSEIGTILEWLLFWSFLALFLWVVFFPKKDIKKDS